MFALPYVWYFMFANFFSFIMLRFSKRNEAVMSPALSMIIMIIGNLLTIAGFVFLIIGFWKMPHWWYPLVLLGLGMATSIIPIPDKIAAIIGIVAGPILTILMYINLFS